MDSSKGLEALKGASNGYNNQNKNTKTLLVHPFTNLENKRQENIEKNKTYLLETPKELKRKTPLLEIPNDFTKKPRFYCENNNNQNLNKNTTYVPNNKKANETVTSESDMINCQENAQNCKQSQNCQSVKVCHHCCCKKSCQDDSEEKCCQKPVKVIFAPAMMPSIFGPVPGLPYIVKPNAKGGEKVSLLIINKKNFNCFLCDYYNS